MAYSDRDKWSVYYSRCRLAIVLGALVSYVGITVGVESAPGAALVGLGFGLMFGIMVAGV